VMRGLPASPLFASGQWYLDTGGSLEGIDIIVY
jgi:hypothetical protein